MAKFCAECGVGLGPADRFCAKCGKEVFTSCPTCGQNWDGVMVENVAPARKAETKAPVVKEAQPAKVVLTSKSTGSGPVYGSAYDATKDCANCGKAGEKKSCDNCGSGA